MRVVVQCAASKTDGAGCFRAPSGRSVAFVAKPEAAAPDAGTIFARPDDPAENSGQSWRDLVTAYQLTRGNPLGLAPAFKLYANGAYSALADKFGVDNLYILSAGWGLIRADFLTPTYDITFSAAAEAVNRRRARDRYRDFCQADLSATDELVFLGGKDYLALFCALTAKSKGERIVIYNSGTPPAAPGCRTVRYATTTRTNWHYQAAQDLVRGTLMLKESA